MKAVSILGNSTEEINATLQQSLTGDFKPTLAIVFLSVKQDHEAVCTLLNNHGIQVFGASTSGEFISSTISEGGIAIMLLDIDPSYFKIMYMETGDSSTYEVSKELGAEAKRTFSQPAFIIASGWLHTDGEQIIKGIEDGFGGEPSVFGGMAGDDLLLSGPIVFTYGKSSVTGVVAIVIDENKIDITGIATCGWKPIGITKTITKSAGNIVYTIDDQPAFDLVIKYLGLNIDEMGAITNTVGTPGPFYPSKSKREKAPPVMRTTMLGNKEDRSLICAGTVPQGAKVRFSLPPDFDVIDTVIDDCLGLKDEDHIEADAVIMFSCISRYLSFGALTSEEIERVKNVWNAPFIGFFCYGEFGRSKRGKHEFHNNTCCVLALKEN